ncbi:MAG TPA: ferrous iron transport protein A [Anaerolineales bacterium]|nr:ferrous iron transport protein A [Anaerolineales bacterium]
MDEAARRSPATSRPTLAEIPPGRRARIAAWRGASSARRQQLQAYGLWVGRWVRVVQQAGATVVLVEHTELALEHDLARMILMESPAREGTRDFGR